MRSPAEQAVLRVFADEDSEGVLGTAFVVAPGFALTCAHVLEGVQESSIRLQGWTGQFSICDSPKIPTDASTLDLALLPISPEVRPLLACAPSSVAPLRIQARGYSPVVTGPGGRELRFEPRDRIQARYDGPARSYRIEEAFDLTGDCAEKGFSGSPLVDIDSGSVIAVLSGGDRARERSWAVPLGAAAKVWPELAAALDWNDENLPRFGPLANRIGAREACAAQARREITRMRNIKKFEATLNVRREEAREALQRFLADSSTAMAIVGGSNTGKTWLLCDVAASFAHISTLLIAAADLPRDDPPSLPDFLTRSLEAAWSSEARTTRSPTPACLAKALAGSQDPLLIVLDGINEALDVRHFLHRWLPEALAWCRDVGAKLLFTTRPEPWPAIARAVPHPDFLFLPDASDGNRSAPAAQRRTVLEDFTEDEVKVAVQNYRLDAATAESLRRHPLLFRVAADLGLNSTDAQIGRYRLFDDFVNRQIDDATATLNRPPNRMTLTRVRRLAGAVPIDGDGSTTIQHAAEVLGDERLLDALVEAGLLSLHANSIRFVYDQINEAMRPAPPDAAALFSAACLTQASQFRRSVVALLRLEADGNEAGLRFGIDRLRVALDSSIAKTASWREIVEGLEYLLQSLPPARIDIIESVLSMTMARVGEIDLDRSLPQLVALVEGASVGVLRRCHLLLALAPWEPAWPLRHKDWSDQSRRHSFERRVQSPHQPNVACALDRLHHADRDLIRPILVDALHDTTRIDLSRDNDSRGEASIASLASGLLFYRRSDDLEGLLDLLCVSSTYSHGVLLRTLAADLPRQLFDYAMNRIKSRRTNVHVVEMLAHASREVDPATRNEAIPELEAMLADPGDLGSAASSVMRTLDPRHVAAWDRHVRSLPLTGAWGFRLNPTPVERFDYALALAETHPEAGLDWMSVNNGPKDQQAAMAALATKLLAAKKGRLFSFGFLAESKIYLLRRDDGDRFRPWLALASAIVPTGDEAALRCLVYAVFNDASLMRDPEIDALAASIHAQSTSESVAMAIVEKIMPFIADDFPLWSTHFALARSSYREEIDLDALKSFPRHRFDAKDAERLVQFWHDLSVSDQSELSARVLASIDDGMTIDAAFAQIP